MTSFAVAHDGISRAQYETGREVHRRQRLKILLIFLICVATWYSVPYTYPLQVNSNALLATANEADAFQGSLSREVAVPVLLLLSLWGLWRLKPCSEVDRNSKLLLFALAYLAWVILSLMWSVEPDLTGKRLLVFAIDVTFVYALARLASAIELAVLGLVCSCAVVSIALFADVVALRAFAPFDPDYRFMGVMMANFQAMNLYVGLVCGLTLLQWKPRWLRWLGPIVTCLCALLFLTRARVGTLLAIVVLLFVAHRMASQYLAPLNRAFAMVLLCAVGMPSMIFAANRSGAATLTSVFMMGRQDTENTASLSNRAPLWGELWLNEEEHPVLGAGFDAFWTPTRVSTVSLDQGWVVPNAHNTYLDQTLSLGFVGAFLYASTLWGACAVAWKRYRQDASAERFFAAALLFWVAALSLTESLPVTPFLPTLIAYACVVKMCMIEPPEAKSAQVVEDAEPQPLPLRKPTTTGQGCRCSS